MTPDLALDLNSAPSVLATVLPVPVTDQAVSAGEGIVVQGNQMVS